MTTLDSLARTAPRPGTAGLRTRQPNPAAQLAVGKTSFLIAPFASGPTGPQLVLSGDELDDVYARGANATAGVYADAYAAAMVVLSRGRGPLVLGRTVGPAAAAATVTLQDAALADSLAVTARHIGADGNRYTTTVVDNGATFDLQIAYDGTVSIIKAGLASPAAAAAAFGTDSQIEVIALGATNPAPVVAVPLVGGDDDAANIGDANWQASLDRLPKTMLLDVAGRQALVGAGQVAMPGRAETAGWQALLDHAAANNRTAFCDTPDLPLDAAGMATLTGHGDTFTGLDNAQYGGLFACWTDYTDDALPSGRRIVPASGLALAATAWDEPGYGTRDWPIAEDGSGAPDGVKLRLRAEPTDTQRGLLTNAGVNHGKTFLAGAALNGFRAGSRESHLLDLGVQRLGMGIDHDIEAGKQQAVGKGIPKALQILSTVAEAVLAERYAAKELDGDDPAGIAKPAPTRAYGIDTITVNTQQTGIDRQARIDYWIRPVGVAELVLHRHVIVPIGS